MRGAKLMFIARLATSNRREDDQRVVHVALKTFNGPEANDMACTLASMLNASREVEDSWVYSVIQTVPDFTIERADFTWLVGQVAVKFK
jgi:hypothetical protein